MVAGPVRSVSELYCLLFSIRHWLCHSKVFRLEDESLKSEIISSEEIDFKKVHLWCESFEKCLLGVLQEFGPFTDFYSQIERTYFYGGQLLRQESPLALSDFFSLSKKVKLIDFVFRKIIWFSGNNPIDSVQARKKLLSVRDNFTAEPEVNASFCALLDDKLKKEFITKGQWSMCQKVKKLDFFPVLSRIVRRVALWIQHRKTAIVNPEMPAHEILMFVAVFDELQFLCDYFLNSENLKSCEIDFEKALKLNIEILNELMEFLTKFYLAE